MLDACAAEKLVARLRRSKYGWAVSCERIYSWDGLRDYLSKEATPQAWWSAGKSFRRIKVGEWRDGVTVTGDRVRLSDGLAAKLHSRGRIRPFRKTYSARRTTTATTQSQTLTHSEQRLPAPNSLTTTIPPIQLSLFSPPEAPVIEWRARAEQKRQALGLSQAKVASLLGWKQSHWSNAIVRRHDNLSPRAQRQLREFVTDRRAA
jgi:hypothetical protein